MHVDSIVLHTLDHVYIHHYVLELCVVYQYLVAPEFPVLIFSSSFSGTPKRCKQISAGILQFAQRKFGWFEETEENKNKSKGNSVICSVNY